MKYPTSSLWHFACLMCISIIAFSCGKKDDKAEPIQAPMLWSSFVLSTEIDIAWFDIEMAKSYQVDVSTDPEFSQLLPGYDAKVVEESQLSLTGLAPATTYYFRARTVLEDDRISPDSKVLEVSTKESDTCEEIANFVFREKDGVVKVEFEDAVFGPKWQLNEGNEKTSGRGYMVWTGDQFFPSPSSDLVTFKIRIATPGTYKFVWNTAVTLGDEGTEHNDTWLRFPDASDFFAKKDDAVVYPKGTGKTPNPEGASADGWFKIYRSGNDLDFKWQARTFDRDPHIIHVKFDKAKVYTMEVSARSSGHAIDQFALYLESIGQSAALSSELSEIVCP